MEKYQWILTLPSLATISLLGMIVHFFKLKIKGETITEIGDYFKTHFKSTATAFIWTVVSVVGYFFTLSTGEFADVVAVFQIGYMCDSFFNKWEDQK